MIGIIDYGLGNIKAFENIYRENGIKLKIIQNYKEIDKDLKKIILPGIGSFDKAITLLKTSFFFDEILNFVENKNNEILGICVGMQILTQSSYEGNLKGLCLVDGVFSKIQSNYLPHMGWNNIKFKKNIHLFSNIPDNTFFYFLHSYGLIHKNFKYTVSQTEYDEHFVSSFQKDNIYGIQFHPEKSHKQGMQVLLNFYNN